MTYLGILNKKWELTNYAILKQVDGFVPQIMVMKINKQKTKGIQTTYKCKSLEG